MAGESAKGECFVFIHHVIIHLTQVKTQTIYLEVHVWHFICAGSQAPETVEEVKSRRVMQKNLSRKFRSFKSFAFAKDLHAKDAKEWPFFQAVASLFAFKSVCL